MFYGSQSFDKLITELTKLPGIGRKSAQRLAFYLLKQTNRDMESLAQAIIEVKEKTRSCSVCFNLTEEDPCWICRNGKRDPATLCVVEEPNTILAIERLGQFGGRYHVLGGVLSPLDNIGPDDLHITELLSRCNSDVEEVIIATNPNTEGEATAIYLSKLLRPLVSRVTRIARGIPSGSDIEFVDEITLLRAIEGRNDL